MVRFSAALAFTLALGAALPALAQTDAEKAKAAEAAAKLAAAIEACDKGAAVPLDPGAEAPPVQYSELFGPTFDLDALKKIADACQLAQAGAKDQKRLRLQWLRSEIALGQRSSPAMTSIVEAYAKEGSAEAKFLLFVIYRNNSDGSWGVDRERAVAMLREAAEAGHRDALTTVVQEYRFGPHIRRDPREAVRFATMLARLPSQGQGFPNQFDKESIHEGEVVSTAIPLMEPGFSEEEQKEAFTAIEQAHEAGDKNTFAAYVTAIRFGRGTKQDAAEARRLVEAEVDAGSSRLIAILAEMLANGEGGPVDGKRAIALLQDKQADLAAYYNEPALAELYLDNRFTGPRPREAIQLLVGGGGIDARIKAAGLLLDYDDEQIKYPESLSSIMSAAAEVGEPGAGLAWARLKLTSHSQFGNDPIGARKILARLTEEGDSEAAVLLAETQFYDLGERVLPSRIDETMSNEQIRKLVDDGTAKKQASAYRLKAKLLRSGVVFPQDDRAATEALITAAEAGDVESMILLGEAYDDGTGIAENPRERLRWWREAARLGSLEATEELADAFTFDTFDKLMNLREGITAKIALYNNGPAPDALMGGMATIRLMGSFSGGRATDAGTNALAAAVMDGYRLAPAGLADAKLLPLAKELPDEIRIEIEKALKSDGFYAGSADGYFGPEVRKALADWVEAKGPLAAEPEAAESVVTEVKADDAVPKETLDRIRDRMLAVGSAPNATDKQKEGSIGGLHLLGQYGDAQARWVLVQNYHQSALVRARLSPGDITRYGLDLLITRPEGAEKVEFEFIFDVTKLYEENTIGVFGEAFIMAARDDVRMQDPLTLGAILGQVLFAPGGCESILAAAKKYGTADPGDDGCGEQAKNAIIAHAKAAGPSGIDADIRKQVTPMLKELGDLLK
jgi:TPR repeat protein/peptidoglycan hydrolase-like protein with peptidoglycan-binding domain